MTSWSEGGIATNGSSLHYTRTGGDKPPLVLLHGFTDYGLCWTSVARALEATYDLIMPDARGHHHLSPLGAGLRMDLLVQDVVALIQTLELECPVVMGHSMGAHTTAVLAANHPELVKAVILEDPPWRYEALPTPPPDFEKYGQQWRKSFQDLKKLSFAERLASIQQTSPNWSEDEKRSWALSKEELDPAVFDDFADLSRALNVVVPNIVCPVLLVTGEISQGSTALPDMVKRVLKTWPRGEYVEIVNAGHSVHRDQFQRFMKVVTTFLARI